MTQQKGGVPRADYEYLRPFAETDWQRKVLDAVRDSDTMLEAAVLLDRDPRNVYGILQRMKKKAAKVGVAPNEQVNAPLPEGQKLKGVSTLYAGDGEVMLQWVKSQEDGEVQETLREIFDELMKDCPRSKPTEKKVDALEEDLMNVHILTDYHMGMNAWGEETGADWDLGIAEDLLLEWFMLAIEQAPPAKTGVLAQLGDFLHWDGLEAVTPTSKHVLDADTRFQKVVRVSIRTLRAVVAMMLDKYDHVHLVMADANHDPASSIWLREVFHAFYDNEPRITVDNSPDTYYCVEHGKTSLFFHHGHKKPPGKIDDVFAAKFRDVWGRTEFSYAHMGHFHHRLALETNLMVVEQHRTMAARDAYASRGGYHSGRSAPTITYHKKFGQVGRQEITPEMLT